jgi:hypothetical protein
MNTEGTTRALDCATPYIVAVIDRPAIVCPPWCAVTYENHVADLPNLEGYVIHWSENNGKVRHSRAAFVDNTVDPTEPPLIFVDYHASDGISLEDAEALARAILAAVAEARA